VGNNAQAPLLLDVEYYPDYWNYDIYDEYRGTCVFGGECHSQFYKFDIDLAFKRSYAHLRD
jgi:hypothetical protein